VGMYAYARINPARMTKIMFLTLLILDRELIV